MEMMLAQPEAEDIWSECLDYIKLKVRLEKSAWIKGKTSMNTKTSIHWKYKAKIGHTFTFFYYEATKNINKSLYK